MTTAQYCSSAQIKIIYYGSVKRFVFITVYPNSNVFLSRKVFLFFFNQ